MTPEAEAAWLAERRKSMGASDIAAAATGRYGGPLKAVASKLGIDTGDDIDPALAERGHRWEQPIADGVLAHHGLQVYGEQVLLRRPDEPRIHVTVDGLLGPPELEQPTLAQMTAQLEVKTRAPRAPWPWDYYESQAQVGMWVTGLPRCLLAVATVDTDYDTATGQMVDTLHEIAYRWIDADGHRQAELVELGLELWAHVEAGTLPEPTGPEALPIVKAANIVGGQTCRECNGTGEYSGPNKRRKYCPNCDGEGRANIDNPPVLDDELSALVARRQQIAAAIADSTAEYDTIEAKLRAAIGEATEVVTADGAWRLRCGLPVRKFTARSEADFLDLYGDRAAELGLLRTVLDRDRAKAEMPEEYDALRVDTPDRRLTVKDLRPETSNP